MSDDDSIRYVDPLMDHAVWKRYDPTDIHWQLYEATKQQRAGDAQVGDADGFISAQAYDCPYYATLDGRLGGDWGVIVRPDSPKFGLLVFEHDWCGCPIDAEGCPDHPSSQTTDAWSNRRD